jgi:hypothetical protein
VSYLTTKGQRIMWDALGATLKERVGDLFPLGDDDESWTALASMIAQWVAAAPLRIEGLPRLTQDIVPDHQPAAEPAVRRPRARRPAQRWPALGRSDTAPHRLHRRRARGDDPVQVRVLLALHLPSALARDWQGSPSGTLSHVEPTPTVGRIVHLRTPGAEGCEAAIIIEVVPLEGNPTMGPDGKSYVTAQHCYVTVFSRTGPVTLGTAIPYAVEGNAHMRTWHWPERA